MDEIWDKKSVEVGGHWPLGGDEKTRMTIQNRQSRTLNKPQHPDFVFQLHD